MAENVVGSVHNIYTLRGAQVRDSLRWSKYINKALYAYDQNSSLCKQVFYVSKTQGEPMVQPDSVTDDFRRKAVASIK